MITIVFYHCEREWVRENTSTLPLRESTVFAPLAPSHGWLCHRWAFYRVNTILLCLSGATSFSIHKSFHLVFKLMIRCKRNMIRYRMRFPPPAALHTRSDMAENNFVAQLACMGDMKFLRNQEHAGRWNHCCNKPAQCAQLTSWS